MIHVCKQHVPWIYTLKQTCECGEKTLVARPPKYIVTDPYAEYRRKEKEQERMTLGILQPM